MASIESVVCSGNSIFDKKRGFRKWEMPKNQGLFVCFALKTKKMTF